MDVPNGVRARYEFPSRHGFLERRRSRLRALARCVHISTLARWPNCANCDGVFQPSRRFLRCVATPRPARWRPQRLGPQIRLLEETMMNPSLSLHPPVSHRFTVLLAITLLALLASGVSQAPTIARIATIRASSQVCTCAHCPGGAQCCCHSATHCPTSLASGN